MEENIGKKFLDPGLGKVSLDGTPKAYQKHKQQK